MSPVQIPVTVYGLPRCPACAKFIKYCDDNNVAYTHLEVDADELRAPTDGWREENKIELLAAAALYEEEFPLVRIGDGPIFDAKTAKKKLSGLVTRRNEILSTAEVLNEAAAGC